MTRALFTGIAVMTTAAAVLPAQRDDRDFGRPADAWCRDYELRDREETACDVREETLTGLTSIDVDTGGNGGITLRGSDRRDVHLRVRLAATARTEADAREVLSDVRLTTSGGRIRADGPRRLGRREWWSATMELEVPRTMRIGLDTTNGGISVADFGGTADLRTTNGGISLSDVSGDIRGTTTNGGLRVRLSGQRWEGAGLDLQATNGGATLDIPSGYSADLDARTTNGGIRIDFPVTVQGVLSRRQISATLGSGGAPLRVKTTNGGISINRR